MATKNIYETTFDEDVQTDSSANQCPECDGRVTTNAVETICEECGLVIDEQRIDHGPEWRGFDEAHYGLWSPFVEYRCNVVTACLKILKVARKHLDRYGS